MSQNFIKLYSANLEPDTAYFLHEGTVFFYASNNDKYAITGKNLIVGATEILMNHTGDLNTKRIETAVTSKDSNIKKMPVDKFLNGMKNFSFILNTSMVLAKQVLLTNQIINKNMDVLAGDEKRVRKFSLEYYSIVLRIKEEYNKRKLPWLKELTKETETNLTFKKGEAYYRSSEPVRITATKNLSDKAIEYERGTVICEENSSGDEMYILQSGVVDVSINGNTVASISEPGTVTGEMALLLGEKRTATLTAKNNVVLTKITKADLKEVAAKQIEVLTGISSSLANRHYYNLMKIENVNKSLIEQSLSQEDAGVKKIPLSIKAEKDLNQLKRATEEAVLKNEAEFIEDLLASF